MVCGVVTAPSRAVPQVATCPYDFVRHSGGCRNPGILSLRLLCHSRPIREGMKNREGYSLFSALDSGIRRNDDAFWGNSFLFDQNNRSFPSRATSPPSEDPLGGGAPICYGWLRADDAMRPIHAPGAEENSWRGHHSMRSNHMNGDTFDALVIGGGINGLSALYHLKRLGAKRVGLVERFSIGHDRGSSHGACPRHAKRLRRARIRPPDAMGARGRVATDRKSRRQTARVFQPRNLHRTPLRASRPLHQRGAARGRGRGTHLCGRGAGALSPVHVRRRRERPAGQDGRLRLGERSRRFARRAGPRERGEHP